MRLLHRCVGLDPLGGGHALFPLPDVQLFPAGRPRLDQTFGPGVFLGGQVQGGVRGRPLGQGAVEGGLVGPGVDLEERRPLLDHLAVLEVHLD